MNLGHGTSALVRWSMAAVASALFLSAFSLTEYLDYINADQLAKSVKNVVPLLTVLMAWVGVWTYVGNVRGSSASFPVHLCVAALAGAALLLLLDVILPMLAFALGWSADGWFLSVLAACGMALLLGIHLRVNHGALSKLALLSVVSVSVAVGASGIIVAWADVELKPERLPYSSRVEPGVIVLIEGQSIDRALTALSRLTEVTDERVKTLRD